MARKSDGHVPLLPTRKAKIWVYLTDCLPRTFLSFFSLKCSALLTFQGILREFQAEMSTRSNRTWPFCKGDGNEKIDIQLVWYRKANLCAVHLKAVISDKQKDKFRFLILRNKSDTVRTKKEKKWNENDDRSILISRIIQFSRIYSSLSVIYYSSNIPEGIVCAETRNLLEHHFYLFTLKKQPLITYQ